MTCRLLNSILTITLLFCVSQAFSQTSIHQKIQQNKFEITSQPLYQITEKANDKTLINQIPKQVLQSKQFYVLQQSTFETIKTNKQSYLRILLPVNNQLTEFHLVKTKLFTPDFMAVTNGQNIIEIDKGNHYWGIAKNNANSLIALSVFDNEVVASIQLNNQKYTLSKYENTNYHLLFKNSDFNYQPNFSCQAIGLKNSVPGFDPATEKSIPDDCVRIHVEADYTLYQSKGSSITNTTNYINGLFNEVAIMYANELIDIAISYINIWTITSPYTPGAELADLANINYGRTHGDLVHLLHRNGGGGVAYLDQLCSDFYNIGVSGVDGIFNSVPTYSWDVMVVSHELGHNMGSPHTHDCSWNGNNTAIDGCGYQASGGQDGCDAPIPPGGGTIMSYCHLVNGINFNDGFGQQPGDLMRNRVANAACLSACGPPTCDDGYQNGDEEGIDCGGSLCIACPTCDDGLLNQDETAVDCGGANCNACPCAGGVGLSLIINPDFYISETTWDVRDASGNIVASGGGYANGQGTTVEALCLPEGCYDFTIYDSYGDGLFDGARTGTYVLIDESGTNLVTGSGNFGPEETTNFCIESACSSIDMNIFFDGFPGQSSWDITDSNGNIVSSGGAYGSQAPNSILNTTAACLPNNCYTLNFYDALGNGMCPFQSTAVGASTFVTPGTLITPGSVVGTFSLVTSPGLCGNYNLTDANGNVLVSGGSGFGSQQSNNFCLPAVGLSPKYGNENSKTFSKLIKQQKLSLHPNPVLNQLSVLADFQIDASTQLQIINILGEVVLEKMPSQKMLNQANLNVQHLKPGTYFVILKNAEKIFTEKFLKQ